MENSNERDPIISGPDSENDLSYLTLSQHKEIFPLEDPIPFLELLKKNFTRPYKQEFQIISELTEDQGHYSLINKRSKHIAHMNRYSDILPCKRSLNQMNTVESSFLYTLINVKKKATT